MSAKCDISDNNDTNNEDIEQIVKGNYPILCITPSVTKALFNAEMPLQEDHFQFKINVLINRRSYSHPHFYHQVTCQSRIIAVNSMCLLDIILW